MYKVRTNTKPYSETHDTINAINIPSTTYDNKKTLRRNIKTPSNLKCEVVHCKLKGKSFSLLKTVYLTVFYRKNTWNLNVLITLNVVITVFHRM